MLDITNTWLLNISSICQLLRETPLKCFVTLQSRDVTILRVQSRRDSVFSSWLLYHKTNERKRKEKKSARETKYFKRDVHDVQCNMEMMTIPMILVMKKNPMSTEQKKKMFVHFCMNCMRNYVQQDANCIAAPVREKKKYTFVSFL